MIGYTIMMSPSKEELETRKRTQDSIYAIQKLKQDSVKALKVVQNAGQAEQTPTDTALAKQQQPVDSARLATSLNEKYGEFVSAAKGEDEEYVIESDLFKITLINRGGRIGSVELKNYKTFDGKPLILFNPDASQFNMGFFAGVRPINTQDLYFTPYWFDKNLKGKKNMNITGKDSLQFAMRLYVSSDDSTITGDQYIEYLYTVKSDNYMIGYKINFVNMGGVIGPNTKNINIDWATRLLRQEKNVDNERNVSNIYYRHSDGEVDNLKERKDDEMQIPTSIKWVSYSQQFFSNSFIADDLFQGVSMTKVNEPKTESKYLQKDATALSIPYNSLKDETYGFSFYYGPNKYNILRKYKMDFERQIPLGWGFFLMQWINRFAVIPVFNFLEGKILNYGIIILILTVLLKIVLLPIAYKTYISSAKMRLLKPEIDEISTKFPKQEDAMKKQQATMTLYKKAGVNPMAGCVPMLLQFPILIAMFRFFPSSIELRQQSFLWASDLSSYDSVWNMPFTIPFYGDHVSLFTLLMTISTIIYTKINNDQMATGNQMPGMKTMMYLMPVMFLGFFNSYSAGLSYYYLLANLFTFAQMFIIRRFVNEDKLHLQLQENKKKPIKKSNFQKKLEEMSKQQQVKR